MLVIIIKDLKMHLSNLNLPLGKHIIYFELLTQKKRSISKWLIYSIINTKNLFFKNICLC